MISTHRLARIAPLLAVPLALFAARPASSQVVAGWDFSQYFGDGLLSLDGETLVDTLPANYSDYDPTFGAGAESADFGTMYLNGAFGSTATPLDIDNDPIVPSAAVNGSLVSNLGAPENRVPSPDVPFDSCTVLAVEGQLFCNLAVLLGQSNASVVFEADLTEAAETASSWTVAFGGRTIMGTSTITVAFSSGGSFGAPQNIQLTDTDSLYSVTGSGAPSAKGYFRFAFTPSGSNLPVIDNVTISVPEAGSVAQALAAIGALALAARRRA